MRLPEAIRVGACRIEWVALDLGELRIEATADALMVPDGHGGWYRPSSTPVEAQQCADLLGACLLTPRLADILWQRADVRLEPQTQPIRQGGGRHPCGDCCQDTDSPWDRCQACGEREHSRAVDVALTHALRELGPLDHTALVAGVGKPWALARSCFQMRGRVGSPYGWHVERGGYLSVTAPLRVLQPLGGVAPHDGAHLDYAEPWRGWRVPGSTPEAALLGPHWREVSHERLASARLPGVPLP